MRAIATLPVLALFTVSCASDPVLQKYNAASNDDAYPAQAISEHIDFDDIQRAGECADVMTRSSKIALSVGNGYYFGRTSEKRAEMAENFIRASKIWSAYFNQNAKSEDIQADKKRKRKDTTKKLMGAWGDWRTPTNKKNSLEADIENCWKPVGLAMAKYEAASR